MSVGLFFTGLNHVANVAKTHYTVLEYSHGLLPPNSQYWSQQLFWGNTHGPPFTSRVAVKTTAAMPPHVGTATLCSPALTQDWGLLDCLWPQGSRAASSWHKVVTGTLIPRHDAGPWGPSDWRLSRRAWHAAEGRHMVRAESLISIDPPISCRETQPCLPSSPYRKYCQLA